jgi:hypothetical protein
MGAITDQGRREAAFFVGQHPSTDRLLLTPATVY